MMKNSILFLILSVVVGLGNLPLMNSVALADYTRTQTDKCTGTDCNTSGENSSSNQNVINNRQGQNQQASSPYIERGCESTCASQSVATCAANNPTTRCDCTQENSIDTQQQICVSIQKLSACGGAMLASGACANKNANTDPDVNGLTSDSGKNCKMAVDSAVSGCDPNKSSDVGAVMQMAGSAQQALSMATGSAISAACGSMGKISEMASAATIAYKAYCANAYSQCQKTCGDAATDPTAIKDKVIVGKLLKQCSGFQQNVAEAGNAVLGLVGAKMNMDQCKNQTVDCTLYPMSPTCIASTDCTNATVAATSVVCICQTNPLDSRCGTGSGVPGGGFGNGSGVVGAGGTTDGTLGQFALDNGSGLGSSYNPTAAGQQGPGTNLAQGMQGGHNLGSTGAVNNAYTPPGGAGGGANGSKAGILSGYYGGGGGGGFGGGSGSGAGGPNGAGGAGAAGGSRSGLDLKQFLPGGANDPARGIAGISGPDGITGPNSDIWQKVNTRYYSVSPSLLP